MILHIREGLSIIIVHLLRRSSVSRSGAIEAQTDNLFEDVPSGHRFLTKVMTAMMENKVISITYCKYSSSTPEVLNIHPYAVKEYEKRWYLIGYCVERKALRLYGLDRIRSIKETGDTFVYPKDFNAREKFVVSFGPYLPEGKPQIIRLKAYGTEALYLKDLPLHESQTLISSDDEGSINTELS